MAARSSSITPLVSILVILVLATLLAWAGSQHGAQVGGVPLFALCGALAFAINGLVFVPAYLWQSERYYDLTGSATYLGLVALVLGLADEIQPRTALLASLVAVWALRLGPFLFWRVLKDGGDGRFERIKPSFPRYLMTWCLQALWVFMTLSCALAAMTGTAHSPLDLAAGLGVLAWLAGFAIEVVADGQKRRFRRDPSNEGRFITHGLWAWSQHPNYFGEILLWAGIAWIALPALQGWQHVTLLSPLFVYVLLTRISGIPLLRARAQRRWGQDPDYQAHLARTSLLLPRPPRQS